MKHPRLAAATAILLIGGMGLVRAIPAAPAPQDVPKKDSLEVRYARAQFQLAETNLKKVERTNQRFAKTLSADVISEYAEDLAIATEQLKNAEQGTDTDLFLGWLRRAQSNLRSAEAVFRSATAANQRQPGTVDELDLKRIQLRVEITGLQLDRGKTLANASMDKKLQWQVQMLNDEVARLKEQTSRITPQTRVYPWRY